MRKLRIKKTGAAYLVIATANRGEEIMKDKRFKELFLVIVVLAMKKYSFVLEAFAIKSNRVELTIRPTKGANLSSIMQWILSVFAKRWNKLNGVKGHVWYDRFKSFIIETYEELMLAIKRIEGRKQRDKVDKNQSGDQFNSCYHRWQGIKTLVGPYPTKIWSYLT